MKITCDIVSDLLPLYIDEVCTKDTKTAVEEHIKKCSECRESLKNMTAENPIEISQKTEIKNAKKPFKKLKLRFIFWLCFGIFCSSVIVFTLTTAGAFDNFERNLYRSVSFIVENAEPADEWVTVTEYKYSDGYSNGIPQTLDYLEIRGLFPKKELSCSFPEKYSAEIRIIDEDGNVVVEPMEVRGGMVDIPLKELKGNEKYYFQYKSAAGGNFAFNLF